MISPTPRLLILSIILSITLLLPTYYILSNKLESTFDHKLLWASGSIGEEAEVLIPGSIMPAMKNETAKAELGRATWYFLHTMASKYPEHPTKLEIEAYTSFIHLFSRLYPCGSCAEHFRALLIEFPLQTSSRNVVGLHLCFLHNRVNERLGKVEFDCSKLNYDCGCGDESKNITATIEMEGRKKDEVTGLAMIEG